MRGHTRTNMDSRGNRGTQRKLRLPNAKERRGLITMTPQERTEALKNLKEELHKGNIPFKVFEDKLNALMKQ